ncbi:MAG TPA: DUF3048 domain-containing protein [Clostridiales bacterium]|nr:MAG: putative lipoprotein YerB precursor [Firmicutes bacterium ADurb.Bin262]HOU10548.1 DUF3048 domain-containing protein [Clostridiales bacterium]
MNSKPLFSRFLRRGAALLLASVIAAGGLSAAGCGKENGETTGSTAGQTTVEETTAPPRGYMNPLTGFYGMNEAAVGKRPVAVVINNAPPARPQWGLCSPDIVVEGMVEGGITRMLWLYADWAQIPKVGSMRSARHDFVEIAEGLDAIFFHWGGSIYAYDAMKKRNVDHVDGTADAGRYFFRDRSRGVAIEHTGYTTGESIVDAIEAKKFRTRMNPGYESPFLFAEEEAPLSFTLGCESASFVFSDSYRHEFRYDGETQTYFNYLNKKPMAQDGGKQMEVKNVIVLYCPVKPMGDRAGCIDMNLTGGTGFYAVNGTYEPLTWKKGGPGDMLKMFDPAGKPLTLNPGKSYIGFVPKSNEAKTVITPAAQP